MRAQARQRAEERVALMDIDAELTKISRMDLGELHALWEQLYGVPTRTHNKAWLVKKLSFRVQELAEGGVSREAQKRISELAASEAENESERRESLQRSVAHREARPGPRSRNKPRDPRLPPAGTVLWREHRGEEHEVTVRERDFEYRGERYPSLSEVARLITGGNWNGFIFFAAALREANAKPAKAGAR
jgi:hypothetical protein